jgi:hypothetical protein
MKTNTKTCPQCRVVVTPTTHDTCPGCGARLDSVPSQEAGAEQSRALAETTSSTTSGIIAIERQEGPRGMRRVKWTVFLNDKPVGQLPEGGRIVVPVGVGVHTLSFALNLPLGEPRKLTQKLSVTGPDDFSALFRLGAEGGTLTQYGIRVAEKRRLTPEEVQPLTTAPESPRLAPAQAPHAVPTVIADVSGTYQAPTSFKFTEVFWRATGLLIVVYWLVRWIFPSFLPQAVRELDFRIVLIPCAILGAVWTGISFLMQKGSTPQEKQ